MDCYDFQYKMRDIMGGTDIVFTRSADILHIDLVNRDGLMILVHRATGHESIEEFFRGMMKFSTICRMNNDFYDEVQFCHLSGVVNIYARYTGTSLPSRGNVLTFTTKLTNNSHELIRMFEI